MPTPLSDLTLPVLDEQGNPLPTRISDVSSARSLWVKTRDADLRSNQQMAKIQAMLDGEPPLPQSKLNEMGQGYLSNFNPGDAKAILQKSTAAFSDMLAASARVCDIFLNPWDDTTDANIQEWQDIMSEQHGLVLRNWAPFTFRYGFIVQFMVWHGVSVAYFSDRQNWQWNVSHLGYFKIPRQTKSSEDEIEYAFLKRDTQPHELLRYIKDPEYAEEEGWNVEAVRNALLNTVSPTTDVHNWVEFEARWKNNDITWGETAPSIPVIHMWVREADSTYSMVQFIETPLSESNANLKDDFICVKRHAFKSAHEAFVCFTREIGTNGTYHGVRGLGADMFNALQTLMRLRNRQVDIAFSAGPVLQAESEEAIDNLQVTPFGPFMLVSEGVAAMQGIQSPNVNNSLQPAINDLTDTVGRNSSSYAAEMPMQQPRERSKFEVQAELEQQAQLSITAVNLYYQPADRLAREIVRRMCCEDYKQSDPGGAEVWEWRRRCMRLGVPAEAFKHIDHHRTRAARVVGFGSPAARRMAWENSMQLFPQLDQFGKQYVLRQLAASTLGWEQADIVVPPPTSSARPPIDYAIADLQNAALASGQPQAILPNENFSIHLEVHTGKLGEFVQMFEEAGQNPEIFPQIVPPMQMIYEHAAQTLEQYQGADAPMYNQALQNVGEILVNGMRHIQKLQNMQEQGQMGGEAGGGEGQLNDDLIKRIMEHQVKLELMQADAAAKRDIALQDAALKRSLRAADTAAEIARKNASARAQAGNM